MVLDLRIGLCDISYFHGNTSVGTKGIKHGQVCRLWLPSCSSSFPAGSKKAKN